MGQAPSAVSSRHASALAVQGAAAAVASPRESQAQGGPERTAEVVQLRRPAPERELPAPPQRGGAEPARALEPAAETASSSGAHRPRSDISGRLTPSAQSAARPPVLASEALRHELAPAAPAERAGRAWFACAGLLGAAAVASAHGPHALGAPVAVGCLALCALGLLPMAYAARAALVVGIAGLGMAGAVAATLERAESLQSLGLMIGVSVLSTALLFRSWHRASVLARGLVGLGLALCGGWLWLGHGLSRLLILGGAWQAWLLPVLTVPFAIVLLLSLLAFMDSRSTGACAAWAACALAWHVLYSWAALVLSAWPEHTAFDVARLSHGASPALIAAPLFVVALSLGLAQLLAVATASPE